MTQDAFEYSNWQAVIDAHPLESHDPSEWLRYGVALLQTIEPGPDVGKQQQQAALAFVQAQKEGATAEEVGAAQRLAPYPWAGAVAGAGGRRPEAAGRTAGAPRSARASSSIPPATSSPTTTSSKGRARSR
jgi:hypothetical protein